MAFETVKDVLLFFFFNFKGTVLEELNSTIRVKHEELEHMTFLVDEKDIEIAEVRSSLQENEIKEMEMAETLRQKEEKLDEVENDLEHANKNLQEVKAGIEESNAKIVELKAIIKQQELEIISMNERLESGKEESEIHSQELCSKTQRLENDLQDAEHKLLEVESELEFTKDSCEKATTEKQEIIKILVAYSQALSGNESADLNVDEESLKAQLCPNVERISALLVSANEVEEVNNKLKENIEDKRLLEQKLVEVQTAFHEQKTALEEEMDELRESVLNEKKLVFELEDKVNFAVNDKNAMEAELRRVLEESKVSSTKDDMEMKSGTTVNSESESLLELEKARENVVQLESEIGRLKEEIGNWENIAKAKSSALEERTKAWHDEMARLTERFEEEKQQLMEQLREISALKVKESEDFCSEKDEKIEKLESKLLSATKKAADYESTLEHYQLQLAKAEYERDTIIERLEKQVFYALTSF